MNHCPMKVFSLVFPDDDVGLSRQTNICSPGSIFKGAMQAADAQSERERERERHKNPAAL